MRDVAEHMLIEAFLCRVGTISHVTKYHKKKTAAVPPLPINTSEVESHGKSEYIKQR